jgi:hypothetical protein
VWGGGARAVRREGNFGGKKGLTCKIRHLGGQNGKTQHGPKVTSSSTRSSWRSPPRPRPSGRCPPRRAVIFDDFLDSHGIQLTPPYTPVGPAHDACASSSEQHGHEGRVAYWPTGATRRMAAWWSALLTRGPRRVGIVSNRLARRCRRSRRRSCGSAGRVAACADHREGKHPNCQISAGGLESAGSWPNLVASSQRQPGARVACM